MSDLIEEKKGLKEFHGLCVEVKKWFEDRGIDVGYGDTNIGHFAIYIQEKLSDQKAAILKEVEEKLPKNKNAWDFGISYCGIYNQVLKEVKEVLEKLKK